MYNDSEEDIRALAQEVHNNGIWLRDNEVHSAWRKPFNYIGQLRLGDRRYYQYLMGVVGYTESTDYLTNRRLHYYLQLDMFSEIQSWPKALVRALLLMDEYTNVNVFSTILDQVVEDHGLWGYGSRGAKRALEIFLDNISGAPGNMLYHRDAIMHVLALHIIHKGYIHRSTWHTYERVLQDIFDERQRVGLVTLPNELVWEIGEYIYNPEVHNRI